MTIEIYFNIKKLLTSATVNSKFQSLFTAVLPVDTVCAFLKSSLSLLVCCLSSCCQARFAVFFFWVSWHCFARRWAALFSWYDIDSVSIASAAIDKSGRVLLNILSDQSLFVCWQHATRRSYLSLHRFLTTASQKLSGPWLGLLIFLGLITGSFRGIFLVFLYDCFGDSRNIFPHF